MIGTISAIWEIFYNDGKRVEMHSLALETRRISKFSPTTAGDKRNILSLLRNKFQNFANHSDSVLENAYLTAVSTISVLVGTNSPCQPNLVGTFI